MGTGSIPSATGGNIIAPTDHNALKAALIQTFVPRNAAGVAEDVAGSLGSSIYRWNFAYIVQMFIGAASNNLKMYEGADGELWLEKAGIDSLRLKDGSLEYYVNEALVFAVNENGIDFLNQPNKIPQDAIATKAKFNVGNIPVNTSGNSSFETIFSTTLNNCIAGKKILFFVQLNVESAVNPTDYRLEINGVLAGDSPNEGATTSRTYMYIIPSDGNYTCVWRMKDFVGHEAGTYIVQEV